MGPSTQQRVTSHSSGFTHAPCSAGQQLPEGLALMLSTVYKNAPITNQAHNTLPINVFQNEGAIKDSKTLTRVAVQMCAANSL